MTVSLKHKFNSPKADSADSTLVQPSNWNDEHALTLAAGKVLGRDSTGAGVAQELPLAFDAAGNVSMSSTGYFVAAVGTTAQRPASPAAGMLRYNSNFGKFEQYNGSAWGAIGGGATISDSVPSNPQPGDLWWKSDEGQMYVYYTDANTSQWVVANAFAGGSTYLPLSGGALTGALTGTSATFSGTVSAASFGAVSGTTGTFSGALSGNTVADATAVIRPLVSGTSVATTSGTAIDFTGIPSWAKRITLSLKGVSLSATSSLLVQLGTSGGPVSSGYTSTTAYIVTGTISTLTSAAGFIGYMNNATMAANGQFVISNLTGNDWVASSVFAPTTSGVTYGAGSVSLGSALTQLRLTSVSGTDTFDGGSANILYE